MISAYQSECWLPEHLWKCTCTAAALSSYVIRKVTAQHLQAELAVETRPHGSWPRAEKCRKQWLSSMTCACWQQQWCGRLEAAELWLDLTRWTRWAAETMMLILSIRVTLQWPCNNYWWGHNLWTVKQHTHPVYTHTYTHFIYIYISCKWNYSDLSMHVLQQSKGKTLIWSRQTSKSVNNPTHTSVLNHFIKL